VLKSRCDVRNRITRVEDRIAIYHRTTQSST
jgi:hypothetical protein